MPGGKSTYSAPLGTPSGVTSNTQSMLGIRYEAGMDERLLIPVLDLEQATHVLHDAVLDSRHQEALFVLTNLWSDPMLKWHLIFLLLQRWPG